MKLRKRGVVLLAAVVALGMLGGCGDNPRTSDSSRSTGKSGTESPEGDTTEEKKSFDIYSDETKKKVQAIEELINEKFYFEVDDEYREKIFYKGLIAGLGDNYSAYLTKEEMESIDEADSGEYVGIGATVSKDPNTGAIYVVKPLRGSPAEEAGLLPGDIFIQIDDFELTTGTQLEEAVKIIRGTENSVAKLKMYRDGEDNMLEFEVPRRVVQDISVEYEMLENGFGYIYCDEFNENTYRQFKEGVDYLTARGMKGLILDLRNNPGGFTNQAASMADYLLEDNLIAEGENENMPGLLVYMEDKNKNKVSENYCRDRHSVDVPIAVIVNSNSASSAEILAGALQDYKKAILVGTKSFGKGIVQVTYKLDDGSAVKLTIASYFLPSGRCIHGEGLEPDVEIEMPAEQRKNLNLAHYEDVQLQKAIEELGGEPLKEP